MSKAKQQGKATLVKMWAMEDGSAREKVVYQGYLKAAKKRIPPSKKEQFRIEFQK